MRIIKGRLFGYQAAQQFTIANVQNKGIEFVYLGEQNISFGQLAFLIGVFPAELFAFLRDNRQFLTAVFRRLAQRINSFLNKLQFLIYAFTGGHKTAAGIFQKLDLIRHFLNGNLSAFKQIFNFLQLFAGFLIIDFRR